MTSRTERAAAPTAGGGALVELIGFDHAWLRRPNEDGTTNVQCVGLAEMEAVSFFSQQPRERKGVAP